MTDTPTNQETDGHAGSYGGCTSNKAIIEVRKMSIRSLLKTEESIISANFLLFSILQIFSFCLLANERHFLH